VILEIDQAVGRTIGWEIADRPATRRGRLLPYLLPRCRNPSYCRGRWKPLSHYPGFSSDLNAVMKAVRMLENHQQWYCFAKLADIVPAEIPAALATPRQWCEAYLKTLKLWHKEYRLP
jgi:hypothetical protein